MIKNVVLKKSLKNSVFKVVSLLNNVVPKHNNYILLYSGNKGISFNLIPLRDYLLLNGYDTNNRIICGIEDMKYAETDNCTYVTHVKAIFYYLKSKYVFYTAGQLPIKPSKSQKVIHLQHGITFKTCGKLTHINNGNEFFFTDCLATSNIYKPIYSKAFGCSEENIYINSEPVTDVFFNGYKKYDLGNYNKIILWTPTFRQSDYLGYDDSETEELLPLFEEKDYSRLNEILKEYNFLLMVKIHPSQDLSRYSKLKYSNLQILSNDDFNQMGMEIYNLLPQVDAIIGDYSSLCMQSLLLDKPMAYVVPDMEEYSKRRGFAFDPPTDYMPGDFIKDKDQFYQWLDDFNKGIDKYESIRNKVKNKVHLYSDGKSCERLVEYCGINK